MLLFRFDLEAEPESNPDKSATPQWAIALIASRRFKRYLRITKAKQVRIDLAGRRPTMTANG